MQPVHSHNITHILLWLCFGACVHKPGLFFYSHFHILDGTVIWDKAWLQPRDKICLSKTAVRAMFLVYIYIFYAPKFLCALFAESATLLVVLKTQYILAALDLLRRHERCRHGSSNQFITFLACCVVCEDKIICNIDNHIFVADQLVKVLTENKEIETRWHKYQRH